MSEIVKSVVISVKFHVTFERLIYVRCTIYFDLFFIILNQSTIDSCVIIIKGANIIPKYII